MLLTKKYKINFGFFGFNLFCGIIVSQKFCAPRLPNSGNRKLILLFGIFFFVSFLCLVFFKKKTFSSNNLNLIFEGGGLIDVAGCKFYSKYFAI